MCCHMGARAVHSRAEGKDRSGQRAPIGHRSRADGTDREPIASRLRAEITDSWVVKTKSAWTMEHEL